MTRKLKFRVWDKENEYFPNVEEDMDYLLGFDIDGTIYVINNGDPDERREKYEIQQFTGLLDKHGAEICEGDILECWHGRKYIAEFAEGSFYMRTLNDNHEEYSVDNGSVEEELTIIGNQFENPEFLEVEND